MNLRKTILPLAAVMLATASAGAAEAKKVDTSKLPPAATATGVTYAAHIKPILDKSCVRCHGAEKPKGKLRLDGLESSLKGGASGKSIVPGKSAESPLVHYIAHVGDDPDYYMPPPGNKAGIPKLTHEQIGLVRAWIDQGAK